MQRHFGVALALLGHYPSIYLPIPSYLNFSPLELKILHCAVHVSLLGSIIDKFGYRVDLGHYTI